MDNYCEITIYTENENQQDLLVALLSEQGFSGFEQSAEAFKAFIPEADFSAEKLEQLAAAQQFTWHNMIIPKQNWNLLWESNFSPVQVDDFAGIRAHFHPAFNGDVKHEILITPKMSFGTGHHATTYMVMQLMRELDFDGRSVFDFGTGTGILAILAEKLGAAEVVAVDNDDWCIENAIENVQINGCARIRVEKSEILKPDQQFDIIIANINRNIIMENINVLKDALAPGGILLLSGLLKDDEKDINAICQSVDCQHQTTIERSGWIACRYFNAGFA